MLCRPSHRGLAIRFIVDEIPLHGTCTVTFDLMKRTTWSRVLLQKLVVAQLVKEFPTFVVPYTVFTEAATGPHSKPDESSPHLPTLFP
jgi:hypothetical protein